MQGLHSVAPLSLVSVSRGEGPQSLGCPVFTIGKSWSSCFSYISVNFNGTHLTEISDHFI